MSWGGRRKTEAKNGQRRFRGECLVCSCVCAFFSFIVLFLPFLSPSSEIYSKENIKLQEENQFQTVRFIKQWPEICIHLLEIYTWFLMLSSAPDQRSTLVLTDMSTITSLKWLETLCRRWNRRSVVSNNVLQTLQQCSDLWPAPGHSCPPGSGKDCPSWYPSRWVCGAGSGQLLRMEMASTTSRLAQLSAWAFKYLRNSPLCYSDQQRSRQNKSIFLV